jgi:hypothetical protein
MMAERRHAQATADAAAMAGAVDLFKHYPANSGVDSGTAKAAALAMASANGYSNNGTDSVVTVNIPPKTAATSYYNGKNGFVEVVATLNQKRGFSGIWSKGRVPITARAVARGQWLSPGQGIIILNPTLKSSLGLTGSGLVQITQAGIIVDSNDGSALVNSNNASLSATSINVVGGVSGGGTYSPAPSANLGPSAAVQDPYWALPAPPRPPSAPDPSKNRVSLGNGNFRYTLYPGSYDGPGDQKFPSLNQGDQAVLMQASSNSAGGIYYLNAGLSSNGANITMGSTTTGGIMFYNAAATSSGSFKVTGNATGTVSLSALTSGPYKGMLYFQARGSTQDLVIAGNGNFSMIGTFYGPSAGFKITGNTSTPASVIGSQYVSDTLTLSGNGTVIIDYAGGNVARVRYLSLVE